MHRLLLLLCTVAVAANSQRLSLGTTSLGTIFGGSGNDFIKGAAVDASGNIYVTGATTSFDLPLRNAFQAANSGAQIIYSSNAGASWTAVANPVSVTPLTPLIVAVDPTNAQVIYAAAGSTVCRSANAGQQFHCVTLTFASVQTTLTSLVINPQQPSTLYASATTVGGVFKSTDSGQTWSNASDGLPSPSFISSVAIDPFHPNVLYAWVGSGAYVSTNAAVSWTRSSMPWPANTSVSGEGIPSFSFDPVTPGVIYGPNYPINQLAVQKSVDGGATWTPLNMPFSASFVTPDPKVSGTIYATALGNNNAPPVYLLKSVDGGITWTYSPLPLGAGGPLAIDPANSQIILAGSFRSSDGGQTWQPTNASRTIQPVFSVSSPGAVYAGASITSDAFIAKFLPDGKTLVFCTYLGGMGNDSGQSIALDPAGNIWVVGSTSSSDFPVTPGAYQGALTGSSSAFLAKFSAGGSLLAATYLGGSSSDSGLGVAIGAQGNPWITVNATSTDFPQTAPGIAATFTPVGYVSEFDATVGHLLYSSSVGGTFDSNGKGIAIDASGNILLTGAVYTAFPVSAGAFHSGTPGQYTPKSFVLKLGPVGQVIYSTYFGGSKVAPNSGEFGSGTEHDFGVSIAVDGSGNAYVAGNTNATDFPIVAGAYRTTLAGGCPYPAYSDDTGIIGTIEDYEVDDVFVLKLSPDGKIPLAATLLGGSCYDRPSGMALSSSGTVYIAGETDSFDFPMAGEIQGAPARGEYASFVSAFTADLSELVFSTYLYAGAMPALAAGQGKVIHIGGATGPGAQSAQGTSFVNPFPTIATDGYLTSVKPATDEPRHPPRR